MDKVVATRRGMLAVRRGRNGRRARLAKDLSGAIARRVGSSEDGVINAARSCSMPWKNSATTSRPRPKCSKLDIS